MTIHRSAHKEQQHAVEQARAEAIEATILGIHRWMLRQPGPVFGTVAERFAAEFIEGPAVPVEKAG